MYYAVAAALPSSSKQPKQVSSTLPFSVDRAATTTVVHESVHTICVLCTYTNYPPPWPLFQFLCTYQVYINRVPPLLFMLSLPVRKPLR